MEPMPGEMKRKRGEKNQLIYGIIRTAFKVSVDLPSSQPCVSRV
jgi:hypothetical protein